MHWLAERHDLEYAPELARNTQALRNALHYVRGLVIPPQVAVDTLLLRAAPRLRALGRVSSGAENIDLQACSAANVEVVRSTADSAAAEAEFMIGALLAMLRRVPVVCSDGTMAGRELGCSTIGLIGMTASAKLLAQLLPAFGCRVLGYDPALHPNDPLWVRWGIVPSGLRELMEQSDGVCLQLPYYQRFRGLLGERVLANAKAAQVLVSISHSALFDETALAQALGSGRLAAAWLDSVEPGLLEVDRPLRNLPNLQVSPRVASTTRESRKRAAWAVARRIDELLYQESPASREFRATMPGEEFAAIRGASTEPSIDPLLR